MLDKARYEALKEQLTDVFGQIVQKASLYSEAMAKYEAFARPGQNWLERTYSNLVNDKAGIKKRYNNIPAIFLLVLGIVSAMGLIYWGIQSSTKIPFVIAGVEYILVMIVYVGLQADSLWGFAKKSKARRALAAGIITQEEFNGIASRWKFSNRMKIAPWRADVNRLWRKQFLPAYKAYKGFCNANARELPPDALGILEACKSSIIPYYGVFFAFKRTGDMWLKSCTNTTAYIGGAMLKIGAVGLVVTAGAAVAIAGAMRAPWKIVDSAGNTLWTGYCPGGIM